MSDTDTNQAYELIRSVIVSATDGNRYWLRFWDTGRTDRHGKSVLAYGFGREGEGNLFCGEDFCVGMDTAIDSDEAVLSLLSFLTLQPGDTDAEYFESYTARQMDWAKSAACEMLGCNASMAEEDGVWPDFITERE